MATSGGGAGGDVPAERAAAALNDLIEVREGAARLRSLLQEKSSPWTELMDGMLNKLSSALSALDTGGAGPSVAGSADDGVIMRHKAEISSAGRARKRTFSRRSQHPSGRRVAATLVDGHIWRKYGQKDIQDSPHPRSYYRCTHKSDKGCHAKRHVQICETDPSKYVITYYGEHTCRDPSTIPMTVDAAGAASDDRANVLIGFAAGYADAGAAAGASSQLATEGPGVTTQMSSSWCTSVDDMFSSSAEPFVQADDLAAVVGSAGMTSSTVGSAPDYGGLGDMVGGGGGGGGGGGAGSFPSSPSSLGFVVGSLGSIGDDDFFLFDP